MLIGGAQVILRFQDGEGFRCQSFDGLAMQNPALIIVAYADTLASANEASELHDAIIAELLAMGAKRHTAPPCGAGSLVSATRCHAENEPNCQKLLIVASDGVQAFADRPDFTPWRVEDGDRAVLPLLPLSAKGKFSSLFPSWVGINNCAFWDVSPAEAVPAVLSRAGVTVEQPKVFISYRQTESASLAIQIFDALGHAGFDVFLDHFRIPPGVNFQARLTEQLGNKSMVLFLESDTSLRSEWVTYEVNVAKTCGLGLQALNLCGAPDIPGVDEALRTRLTDADFMGGSFGPAAELTGAKLQDVVALVRTVHDRAIIRRRKMLEVALEGAVLRAGGRVPTSAGFGTVLIDSKWGGKRYVVALTPRPPDLPDFHRVHGQAAHPMIGVVVGLSRLMEPSMHQRLTWLAGVSTLIFRDEGELLSLGNQMVQGTL